MTLEYLVCFIRANYPAALGWDIEPLADWVAWSFANGRGKYVVDAGGRLVGFGIARPIMRPEDAANTNTTDPEGGILMIDMLIAETPAAFREIVHFARHRFGERPRIVFQREGSPPKVYPSTRFFRTFDPVATIS